MFLSQSLHAHQIKIVGYSIGNDIGSRDIEGQPLYLPQAKTYDGCPTGPCIYVPEKPLDEPLKIELTIKRQGAVVFRKTFQ